MILTEQLIKRIGRKYWRGSSYLNWDTSLSQFSCLYITTDEVYAFHYSYEKNKDVSTAGYLTEFYLKSPINLFNARSKKDRNVLEDYIRTHNTFLKIEDIEKLTYLDWLKKLGDSKRESLIQILKDLKYDGFVNFESDDFIVHQNSHDALYQFTGIGLFNSKCLLKGKVYKGYEEIKKLPKIKEAQEEEKKWIIGWFLDHKDKYFESKENCIDLLYNLIPNIKLILSYEDLKNFVKHLDLENFEEKILKIEKLLKECNRKSPAYLFL